ncbi:hypothetical protein PIB30_057227 [Stylosanthes scabra]|uniref:Uncharacterized protein n=1 Tax=Stylosanthes scabra TaxID=79078 RepID=A0ABU6QJ93_9FABA|nr:hypothetical protein [Stylosanthes scabra]
MCGIESKGTEQASSSCKRFGPYIGDGPVHGLVQFGPNFSEGVHICAPILVYRHLVAAIDWRRFAYELDEVVVKMNEEMLEVRLEVGMLACGQ